MLSGMATSKKTSAPKNDPRESLSRQAWEALSAGDADTFRKCKAECGERGLISRDEVMPPGK